MPPDTAFLALVRGAYGSSVRVSARERGAAGLAELMRRERGRLRVAELTRASLAASIIQLARLCSVPSLALLER
jgi:hypothetical protein